LQVLLGRRVKEVATRIARPGIEIPGWEVSATPAVRWTEHQLNRVQRIRPEILWFTSRPYKAFVMRSQYYS
jgi:hypothetical protein